MTVKKIIELFGGIGAPRKALENLKMDIETTYIENNKKVVNVYNVLYKEQNKITDVKDFKPKKDNYDLLIAGFPCQPFSVAGKRLGFEDERGKLYKDTLRIIKESLPKNIILENVKGLLQEKNKWIIEEIVKFLENLGYSVIYKVLNAYEFCYIQKRERIFILASRDKKLNLKDFELYLENYKTNLIKYTPFKDFWIKEKEIFNYNLNEIKEAKNYYIIPRKKDGKLIGGSYNRVWKFKEALGTVTISNNLKIGMIKDNKLYYRQITEKEAFLAMDFTEKDYNLIENANIPKSNINFVAGNSMIVGIIQIVINYLLNN